MATHKGFLGDVPVKMPHQVCVRIYVPIALRDLYDDSSIYTTFSTPNHYADLQ